MCVAEYWSYTLHIAFPRGICFVVSNICTSKFKLLLQEMEEDWGGLLFDILAIIAGGRKDLKVMRRVCKSWQAGYESSVTKIRQEVP